MERVIIFPSITDPYVYLKELENDPDMTYRRVTYQVASSYLNIGHLQNMNSQKKQNALDFLKQQAEKERANEIAFLSSKLQQLGKYDGERIQSLTDMLNKNPDDINYIVFIRELNEVMKGVENTEKRVRSLLDSKSGRKNLNRFALNAADQVLSDLKATRTTVKSDMDELIRGLAYKFFEEECGEQIEKLFEKKGINTAAADFTALAVYLQQSIYSFLLDNKEILNYIEKTEVEDFDKELKRIYPIFLKEFEKTSVAQSLKNGGHQLKLAIKEVSSFFHIETEEKVVKKKGRKKSLNEDTIQQLFSHGGKDRNKQIRTALRRVKIKTQFQAQQFGNFKELGSLLNEAVVSGVNVGAKGGGTDTIFLGHIKTSIDSRDFDEQQLFQDEQRILEDLKKRLSSDDNTEENTIAYKEALEKLNELYHTVKGIKNSFIISESTKYYQEVEKGKIRSFSGRNIGLLNYIDKISHLGDKLSIDTKWLRFAALNLADNAAGSHLVHSLEYYFTTFIGLIMFDDFELTAKNFTSTLPNSKIEAIHLYRLQDLYFPTSYFLEQTYMKMTQISDELYNNNGFSLKIITKPIPQNIVGSSEQSDWENVKQFATENTKIDTAFAANFLQLVSQIFPS